MAKPPVPVWIILLPILIVVVISAVLPLLAPIGERPPDEKWGGLFYSNSDDPSLLVPKRRGIGYTLNFGNPWSWAVLLLIFLLVLLPVGLSVVNISHTAR
jgi:uncharacterized membrane protein